jgi:hypothetical protein
VEENVPSIFRDEERAKQETSMEQQQAEPSTSFWLLVGLFVKSEKGGDMLFQNVGWLSMDYTASYPRRHKFTSLLLFYLLYLKPTFRYLMTNYSSQCN